MKNNLYDLHSNYMIPFLWMHGEDEAEIRRMISVIHSSGIGALCVESRPHPNFLGPKWWQDMDVVLDECRKHDMDVWILDDEHFPTGYAAGQGANSEYRIRYLREMHVDIAGPQAGTSILLNLPVNNRCLPNTDPIISVTAARRIPNRNMDHSTFINIEPDPVKDIIDLTPLIDGDVVYWDIPEGLWRIFIITAHYGLGDERRDKYINPLASQGTRILIDTVYEAHYKHYAREFGKTIKGFFSDEPQFGGGYGYHAKIGRSPNLALPWSDEVLALMNATIGCDAIGLMAALWNDIGDITPRVRFAYMDAITRLYSKNFCGQIGDWCRAHGVEYMGHVIEENNAHARLGAGTGHYFRALWGQDFAGIDIVLNGLIPGIKGGSHAQSAAQFEADDDFFYYCLAQLATSLSHIDPKKRGRAMCEIFGAYGWQEGLREMKWLADFMMSRGINVFVPHAFTLKSFPDPDCPPHFYGWGNNPQSRYFHLLMEYMNRVCDIISNGHALTEVGILYHADAEWANDEMMKTQEAVRVLAQSQIECDILPADAIISAGLHNGALIIGDYAYKAIVIPYASMLPAETICALGKAAKAGVDVIFINAVPRESSTVEVDIAAELKYCNVSGLEDLKDTLSEFRTFALSGFEPDLKLFPYAKNEHKYILMFNESILSPINSTVSIHSNESLAIYDPYLDSVVTPPVRRMSNGYAEFDISIAPYELKILVIGNITSEVQCLQDTLSREIDISGYKVSVAEACEYPRFTPISNITAPTNLNCPDAMPRFSGTIRYEGSFEANAIQRLVLDLGTVGETAEVFVNGHSSGVRIAPPYSFDITKYAKCGQNELVIEVTNTLVYKMHDGFSAYHAIQPSGLIGPVRLLSE
jgi:hypothetical protein